MKLSDYKGEKALEILANLIEPAAEIFADAEVVKRIKSKNKLNAISYVIKNHKNSIFELLAAIEDEPVEKYKEKVTIFTLPAKLLQILNDPELGVLFGLQGQTGGAKSSGSASENTEA